jgi:hypothetical protein
MRVTIHVGAVQTCGARHTGLQCLPLNGDFHIPLGQAQGTAPTDGYLDSYFGVLTIMH